MEGCKEAGILLEGIHRGLISAHTAGVEMNYFQRRGVNGRGSENAAKARDWALHKLLRRPDPMRQPAPVEAVAPERAPDAASSVEGKAKEIADSDSNAAAGTLK